MISNQRNLTFAERIVVDLNSKPRSIGGINATPVTLGAPVADNNFFTTFTQGAAAVTTGNQG